MRVSIDVTALRGVISDVNDTVELVFEEWTGVGNAAADAVTSAPSLSRLGEHSMAMSDAAADLQARLDLAILVNTGDDGQLPDDGTLTYELPGSSDSIEAVKEQLGVELAEVGRNVYPWTPDQYREYTELVERYSDDGAVTSAMYQELGPEGSLALIAQFADDPQGYGLELPDQRRLLDAMQDSLESATEEPGFPDETFGNGLVEAATRDPEELMRDGGSNYTGALSFLLYDSEFSEDFTRTVVEGLDHYERVENDGVSGLWGHRPDMGVDFSAFFPYEAGNAHEDPMISAMSALENNPELALEFFSDTDAGADDDTHTRVNYYIKHRTWDGDAFRSLSGALDAATTTPSLISDPESQTAEDAAVLASRTVEFMADRYDIDEISEKITWGENPASENFAHILSTYMVGVDQRLQNPDDDIATGAGEIYSDAFDGYIANVPTFSTDGLEKFSLIAMASDEGFAQVRNGLNDYRGNKLGTLAESIGLSDSPSDSAVEQLRTGIQQDAALEGFFIEQIGESRIADGAAKDARIEAWVDFGSGVVDAIPVPGVSAIADQTTQNLVNLAVDNGKGHGYGAIKDALATHEQEATRSANTLAETTVRQQEFAIAQLLADRGLAADPGSMSDTTAQGDQIIDYEQFSDLNDQDQDLALSEIFSSDLGVGDYFNRAEYEGVYLDEFEEYFEGAQG